MAQGSEVPAELTVHPRPDLGNRPRRAAFLDRDGTIIEDRHYIADPAEVALISGSATALLRLRALGLALVVVTN